MSFSDVRSQLGWFSIALAAVVCAVIGSSAVERVRSKAVRKIEVTGSAKKRIVSDLIEWRASVELNAAERIKAYRELTGQAQAVTAYLAAQGVKPEEIRAGAVTVGERIETEWVGTGEDRVERKARKGFDAAQTITVRSGDVERVERLSREITQLLERGVPVTSSTPRYFYTRLGELKVEMLAQAAKDARTRADSVVAQTGASLGKLRSADMGVINVNPANSTETSWQGNNDTSSLEKDIVAIVHVTFELD
jgi:hypothetical protein